MIKSQILNLCVGRPQLFRGIEKSSIARAQISAAIMLSQNGLEGDEVADTKNHGGLDKALHLYPYEHYAYWQEKLGSHKLLNHAGAFGENISALGLTEDKVKIGDQFQIGGAIIELSHGRQPCWKIEHYFQTKHMIADILRRGHCGLYFRVLQDGIISKGDIIEQIYTANHGWSVLRVFKTLYSNAYKDADMQSALKELLSLTSLADAWKQRAKSLIK